MKTSCHNTFFDNYGHIKYQFLKTQLQDLLMDCRQIIEREGLYSLDLYTSHKALTNLNIILDSERHEPESIFYQTQSDQGYPHTIFFHTMSTRSQDFERVYDGTIFQTSNSLLPQDFERTTSTSISDFQNQNHEQNAVVEEKSEKSSEFVCRKIKKENSETKGRNKKIDKEKNIFPNIAKRTAKMMFQDCREYTKKYFQKRNINFSEFERQYKTLMDSNCSGLALSEYFNVKKGKQQMSRGFVKLFEKYLRKSYMLVAMRRGKMEDMETYIGCKNRQLMYFSEYIQAAFK